MEGPTASRFRVDRPGSVDDFLARAGDFLATHEAENNLLLGICSNLRANPTMFEAAPRFAVVVAAVPGAPERVVAAALQTPPHQLVLSRLDELDAVDALADALAGDAVPGVLGARSAARHYAERWAARTGGSFERRMAERIFQLRAVRAVRSAPGRMRLAAPADQALIAGWLRAFAAEALAEAFEDAEVAAERWIVRRGRTMYLWQDGDRIVSMCGAGGATPTGIRIGPVYTAPEDRGRGYASNLVAQCSQAQLDAGCHFVFLFTDLANPTSNRIYRSIGYEPVADVERYVFRD